MTLKGILRITLLAGLLVGGLLAEKPLAQPTVQYQTADYSFYFYKDYKMSGQEYFESRQEIAQGWGPRAKMAKEIFGPIVTEIDYTYILFSLKMPDNKVLHIPKGTGNFVLTTISNKGTATIPDEGVFIFQVGERNISTQSSTSMPLFVNSDRVSLNRDDEPRVIVRFPRSFKLEQIVRLEVSDGVGTIKKRK